MNGISGRCYGCKVIRFDLEYVFTSIANGDATDAHAGAADGDGAIGSGSDADAAFY